MSSLSDIFYAPSKKSGKTASQVTEKMLAKAETFITRVSQMHPWQVVNFGYGTGIIHGVRAKTLSSSGICIFAMKLPL